MAEPRKIVQGGLKALEAATKAVDAEDAALAAVKAAERAAAGRRAADVAKATAPMKMSEALGNMNVEGKGALKITQADRTRVGGGNIGGPMFSGLQQVDPIYEGAVWGVGDKSTASKMINQSDENTFWTTVLGSADQLKTNPIVFNKLRKGFVDSMKQGNLSDELAGKINHNLSLVFGEGADIRDPKIWQKANTFEKRGALADAMLGQGVPPSKGGVSLGGEKSGKGVIFRPTDILKRETEPALLHPEHGGDVPSFSVGPRLFTLSGDVKERPDLHPGFPVILQGEDKGVVFTPVPGIDAMPDYVKRHEAVKGRKPSGYFDWTLGLKGEGLPTQPITEEYLTYLQKLGKKEGGAVQESPEDMAQFQKRFALHKATGGKVNIPHLTLKKAGGGSAYKRIGESEDDSPVNVGIQAHRLNDEGGAGLVGSLNLKEAGRLGLGANVMSGKARPTVNANYSNRIGDLDISAGLAKQMDVKDGPTMTNLMASYPIGEGRISAGLHGAKADGSNRLNARSLGYNTRIGDGDLNLNVTKPVHGKPMFGVQYNKSFADGGKMVRGLTGAINKASKAVDAEAAGAKVLPAVEREANLAKYLEKSKVKNRAYHATNQDVKRFDPKADPRTENNPNIAGWMTNDPEFANDFASQKFRYWKTNSRPWEEDPNVPSGVNIMPVHLAIENPFYATDLIKNLSAPLEMDEANAVAKALGVGVDELLGSIPKTIKYKATGAEREHTPRGFDLVKSSVATDAMKRLGHDGVIAIENGSEVYAPFKETQIKSATGNRGTYDINEPDITKADGGKIVKGALSALQKATKAVDAEAAGAKALTAAERDANKAKFLSDSVVKDRLYHGTKNDIKSFDLTKRGNSDISSVGGGVYLTPEPSVASFYSKIVPGESGANVMPVYAQVKNPFEYDLAMPFKSQKDSNEFSRKLQEAGYDSIIKRDKDGQISELVVFEPNKIKSAIGNRGTYDTKDPDITKAKGGAVQHDSLEDLEKFHRLFALHKATGGKVNIPHLSLKRVKKFDGGGMAVQSPEETVTPYGGEKSRGAKIAEKLYELAKEQGKEEVSSLKKPRAATDLLNRGVLANNPVSATVDFLNWGLGGVDAAINAMRSPTMSELVTGKQDKKYLSSEKPFLGSEQIKDLMNKYGVTSGEERPLMETALSFLSPTAVIKGAQKTVDVAKKAPEMVQRATNAFTSSKLSPLATEAKTASAGKPTGATYATKQEGPFFRVRPTSLDQSTAKGRGVREADEFQGSTPVGGGAGSSGSAVPTRLSDEEVARIIADPAANEPLNIAKKYTQETQGTEFTLPQMPESSLVKQSAIGRVQEIASEGSPEYKRAIFDAYAREMPEVLEQSGAKNYDDLMEKAYRQMAKETDAQFQALPYNFSYHRAGEGNYLSSNEMAADVHGNKHLYVYQGGDKHDFLNRIDPVTGLNENEKFRAVHDLLGHAIYGNQFGPKGEEVAWAVHSQMYSPLARLAMTAETRGQNSMVNYSPLNANLKAQIAKYDSLASEARRRGDTALLNEINAAKRQAYSGWQYAPNKAVLLPPEFLDPKYAGGMPSYLEAANRPAKGTETQSVLTHFSHSPELQFVDPKRYGTGIKGAEAERLRDFPGGVRDRSYFYMGEPGTVSPEPGLGVNRYRGEASSLYDITQDPLNFRVLARESNRVPYTSKYNQGITSPLQEANDMERLVKEYGYQGMANPKASKPMAIMFKETPVRRNARGGLTLMK